MRAGVFIACIQLSIVLCCCVPIGAIELPRAGRDCNQAAEAERVIFADVRDGGAQRALLSAHRGGKWLAPENTMWAYRHAFAYDMDFVEIDVRETLDGVFVSMHDSTVDRTTNGSGKISQLTWAQIEPLNATDYAPWKGSEYDPSTVPRLEEILELARDSGKGIEFDVKSVSNYRRFFDLVAEYGLLDRSYFNLKGKAARAARTYNPEIRVIFNVEGGESASALYEETYHAAVYGSHRDRFTPQKIAAIHESCALVLPHSYDRGRQAEGDEFRRARSEGADGAQVNQPDVIADVAERHVAAELIYRADARQACLLNTANKIGIPRQVLFVFHVDGLPEINVTDREGCVALPFESGGHWVLHFGTSAVQQATLEVP